MTPDHAIETRGLSKSFGSFRAVQDLNLQVEAGEVFGFLGSNGAGKSTAIRMLCALMEPSGGTATVLGLDVTRDPEGVKRNIGYMSQRFSLYEDLTVAQNIDFFGGVYGLTGKALRERSAWAIRTADLAGKEDAFARALPGGWKQRLALACAVLHQPRVLFLDEPTGGVDPISRRRFWDLIDGMAGQGVTIVVTTHYMDEAEHCDRIGLMHAGRLVALGSVQELKEVLSGRTVFEVTCARPLEVLDRLEKEDWVHEVSVFGTRLHVVVDPEGTDRDRLVRRLEEEGFGPVTAEPIVPSLEDVFIHAIETAEEKEAR